jgi:hypothetical protein
VREWHAGGAAGFDREGDADDLGLHVVEGRGLGVEGHELRRLELPHPALEAGLVEDHFVLARAQVLRRVFGRFRAPAVHRHPRARLGCRVRPRCGEFRRRRGRFAARQLLQE